MLRSDAVAAVTPPAPPLPGREEGGAQAAVTWQGGGREEQPAGREQFGLHSWTGREEGGGAVLDKLWPELGRDRLELEGVRGI